jgi:hypothetical protein
MRTAKVSQPLQCEWWTVPYANARTRDDAPWLVALGGRLLSRLRLLVSKDPARGLALA